MNVSGSNELTEWVLSKELCIDCGACNEICPYFKSFNGRNVRLFNCDLKKGKCFAYCPKIEVDLDELSQQVFGEPYTNNPLGSYLSIKISGAGKSAPRGNFQSGGTVSSLIGFALEQGLIDSAILTDRDGLLPVPRIVTSPGDVVKCSSSKYTATPTLSGLNAAIKEGYNSIGAVLTPCQATAIAQMRSNPMEEPDFKDPVKLVIGLFCTWSLDYRLFDSFISNYVEADAVIKMDIPPPPAEVLEIFTGKDKIEIPLDEVRKNIYNSCLYCIDMSSEFADVSVGVLEGNPGKNTIIIRTELGQELVAKAVEAGYLIVDEMPGENLKHLETAAYNKKKRALDKMKKESLLNTIGEEKFASLRVNDKVVDKFLS